MRKPQCTRDHARLHLPRVHQIEARENIVANALGDMHRVALARFSGHSVPRALSVSCRHRGRGRGGSSSVACGVPQLIQYSIRHCKVRTVSEHRLRASCSA